MSGAREVSVGEVVHAEQRIKCILSPYYQQDCHVKDICQHTSVSNTMVMALGIS